MKEDGFYSLISLSDEDLVKLSSENDNALSVLISRYMRIIRVKANKRALNPGDADDLIQDGFLGLINAVKGYDSEKGVKFLTYANICINNKITDTVSKKSIIEQNEKNEENEEKRLWVDTPEDIVIRKEKISEMRKKIKENLSDKEYEIFKLFLNGMSYDDMAKKLGIPRKSVDNAMQRVRRKLRDVFKKI